MDLSPLKDKLSYVIIENGSVRIGAMTTLWELRNSPLWNDARFAGFVDVWKGFGTMAIRFNATIGGNIGSATQYSDLITLLLVYDARVKLASVKGTRVVPLEELLIEKRQLAMEPRELIVEVQFEEPPRASSTSFSKFDRRKQLIAGIVTGAAYLELEGTKVKDVRISFDMVRQKRVPGRAKEVEGFLKGKELSDEVLEEAAGVLEKEMQRVSDWWTSAWYRLEMSKVVLKRNLLTAKKRIEGGA